MPEDWLTADEERDYHALDLEDFITSDARDVELDFMDRVIEDLDLDDPDVEGLNTPHRLLSPDKNVRAGALSIMYTRTRTRMINMSEHQRVAYSAENDGALFYEDLDEAINNRDLYYKLYLLWKMDSS